MRIIEDELERMTSYPVDVCETCHRRRHIRPVEVFDPQTGACLGVYRRCFECEAPAVLWVNENLSRPDIVIRTSYWRREYLPYLEKALSELE